MLIKEKYFPKKTFVVFCFFTSVFEGKKDNSFPLENIFHTECPSFPFVIPSQSFEYFCASSFPLFDTLRKGQEPL